MLELTSIEHDDRVKDVLAFNKRLNQDASILNTHRDPVKTTNKYTETDDVQVIQILNDYGWFITDYQEVKPHKRLAHLRQGFQKYMATYENSNFKEISLGRAQLLQRGSHDGSSLLQLDAGFFTFACLNGLAVGNKLFDPIKVKHIGNVPLEIEKAVRVFTETCPLIFEKVEQMATRDMSSFEVSQFAKKACALRFDGDKYKVDTDDLLVTRHPEQKQNTLWNVFNRVQENLIKPTDNFKVTTVDNKQRKPKKIYNIDTKVKLNKDLWNLASEYLVH